MSHIPKPNNEHVILLHGITKSAKKMRILEQSLQKAGYLTHNINYPSTAFTLEKLAQQKLAPIVEHVSKQAQKVHFVTHSMGGVLLRTYLMQNHPSNIERIVMIAAPNHGSEVTQFFRHWPPYQWIYGPAGQQLCITGKESIYKHIETKPLQQEIGIIAGHWTFEFWFRWLFKGRNDGKVSVSSTKLSAMKDHLTVPFSHGNIVRSQYVARQTIRFLKLGLFARKST